MAKDKLPGINSDTQSFLEDQVKKGKPRKFFIIYKGATIRSLVVFKKGPFGPKILQAKKAGFKGDVLCGVVTGSGVNLTFMVPGNAEVAKVMKSDSWTEKVPIEDNKLRKFFLNNDLSFKPSCQILLDPLDVPGVEDDSEQGSEASSASPQDTTATADSAPPEQAEESPPAKPQQAAEEMESSTAPDTTEPADPQESAAAESQFELLEQRFHGLKPRIRSGIAAHPEEAEDLKDLALEFRESMGINDLEVASEWLDKLEEALDELPEMAPEEGEDIQRLFEARLKALAPVAVPIAKGGGANAPTVTGLLKTVQSQRGAKDFVNGMATLDQLERELEQGNVVPPIAEEPSATVDPASAFRARLAGIVPRIKPVVETPYGAEAKRLAGEAATISRSQDYTQANALLDQAEAALLNQDSAPQDDVLAIWREAKESVDGQIERLTTTLRNSQHPYLQQVAELGLSGLTEDPGGVFVGMMTSLFEFQNAPDGSQQQVGNQLRGAISNYRGFLDTNQVLEVLDSDPL